MVILKKDPKGKPKIEEAKTEEALDRMPPEMVEKMKKREILRNRIKFVGKMAKMMRTLREDRETVVKLKGLAPDNKIPMGLLTEGHEALEDVLGKFEKAKNADMKNEMRPE